MCPQGTACTAGTCACTSGKSLCNGVCVDASSDSQHCGNCATVCSTGMHCSSGACACDGPAVSFASNVAPVLANACTNSGCHAGAQAKASLDLTLGRGYSELVNVTAAQCSDGRKLVAPGASSSSYLLQKLLGVQLCSGTQMPKAGSSLPSADLSLISRWICQGAPP